jgi:hypothetical protein
MQKLPDKQLGNNNDDDKDDANDDNNNNSNNDSEMKKMQKPHDRQLKRTRGGRGWRRPPG